MDRHVAVLQDLQGPKIRTRDLRGGVSIDLVPGQELIIGEGGAFSTTYPQLHHVLSPGNHILLDDGRMELEVISVVGQQVHCQVIKGGLLESEKGVNLPDVPLDVPSFTDKDGEDLEFGLNLGVDWIAMSFVRQAEDVMPIKKLLKRHGVRIPVMAKIERPEALHNVDKILRVFDGIMVARGDLGVEIPPEEVPEWQKTLIQRARRMGKVVIVATQMLESMMQNPRPTRAEASDVANAVLDGTDAVMLSGETAVGSYPVESVLVMARIIEKAENAFPSYQVEGREKLGAAHAVAHAACILARDLRSQSLVVLTHSGSTAHLVSMRRPPVPIIAFTAGASLARQLSLRWGVIPIVMAFPSDTEVAIARVEELLLERGLARPGGDVVIVGSTPFTARGRTNFLKVHRIQDK
jgi:pyruvate kinase